MLRILAEALTFDDVSLVPAHSSVLPKDVRLATQLTRNIRINLPIVSAAMDTVTEARLAIAMAQLGGIGILHKNMSAAEQAAHVAMVKNFEAGVIREPFTVGPDTTIGEVLKLTRARNISGVPVVDKGRLVGIVTSRDLRFETRFDAPVREIMTPQARLVTVPENADKSLVLGLLHKHRIEKVLVVNDDFALRGLITVKDIQKRQDFPNATRDAKGRLRCAAAVGVGSELEERVEALVGMGVDAVTIDTAHGHSAGVVKAIERIKAGEGGLGLGRGRLLGTSRLLAVVEADDVADVDLREDLVALLHFAQEPLERGGYLLGLGDHRDEHVGQRVENLQLDYLGIHHDEPEVLGALGVQDGGDDGVDADRLTGTGGARDEQMRHLSILPKALQILLRFSNRIWPRSVDGLPKH